MSHRFLGRFVLIALGLALTFLLAGCGGSGGSGGSSRTFNIPVTIMWPSFSARGTDLTDAQSVNVSLTKAGADGSDLNVNFNRTAAGATTDHYSLTANGPAPGPHELLMIFYNQVNGKANPNARIVGMAAQTVAVTSASGATLPTVPISFNETIASVAADAGQSVNVGTAFLPSFTALDNAGNVSALTPTAAQFQIGSGADKVEIVNVMLSGQTFTQQQIGGLNAGTATFAVTVAGKASASVDLSVIANPVTAAIAEATANANGPSVRITIDPAFGGAGNQQLKLFRLPDFPYSVFFGGGTSGASAPIPIVTDPPTIRELTDIPSPNFYYNNGKAFLISGGGGELLHGCTIVTPANAATLDVGFASGTSYQYQVVANISTEMDPLSATCAENGTALSGQATPLAPVRLFSPQDQTSSTDLTRFYPQFGSRAGADVFQLEISTDRSFTIPARIYKKQLVSTAATSNDAIQTLPTPLDLTAVPELLADPIFATFVKASSATTPRLPTIYWRVGARRDADRPGPVHWISHNATDPDRTFRYVYSEPFSFSPPPVPPSPPGRAIRGEQRH